MRVGVRKLGANHEWLSVCHLWLAWNDIGVLLLGYIPHRMSLESSRYKINVNDQDEVGFANSERCEHERRLTLKTDCIYTYDEVMHRTITETDEYRTKREKTGRRKKRSHPAKRKTNTDLSSPIFSKFPSLHLNPLETQGPIIDLRKPSSAGEKPAY